LVRGEIGLSEPGKRRKAKEKMNLTAKIVKKEFGMLKKDRRLEEKIIKKSSFFRKKRALGEVWFAIGSSRLQNRGNRIRRFGKHS